MKFYHCTHCGSIIVYYEKSACDARCCGEPMVELVPNTTDAAQEKHVPVANSYGTFVTVTVGSTAHPMTEDHHIAWVVLETNQGCQKKDLPVDGEPKAVFALADGEKALNAYAYCNLHGLWKACVSECELPKPKSSIVAYFSTGSAVKAAAERIAKAADADVYEIAPETPYTEDDLDWTAASARCNIEMKDDSCRPNLAAPAPDLSQYKTVYLGYPIWWGKAPRVIDSFIDAVDLNGKKVVPFCTSGGAGIGESVAELREICKDDAVFAEGLRITKTTSDAAIERLTKE